MTTRLKLLELDTDVEALINYGLAGLRRHRLTRLSRQAYDQGDLLSFEDLAMLLTTNPATIRREVQHFRQQGLFIMTRGTNMIIRRRYRVCCALLHMPLSHALVMDFS